MKNQPRTAFCSLLGAAVLFVASTSSWAASDDVIPIESAAETARILSAELVALADCGHVPYIEAPEPLFAALTRFLA
mgnify:CR=1 FL=1